MKFARYITLNIICLVFALSCTGQEHATFVRNMFEDSERVESVRQLVGTVNGVHAVELWLGKIGNSYRGIMSMNSDSLIFELIGNVEGDKIVLQEIDQRGQVTGYVRGSLGLDRFDGRWWSADVSRSAELRLREKGLILLEKFEPSLTAYSGNIGEDEFNMWLWYEAPDLVSGIVFTDDICTRVFGACKNEFCREISVEITDGSYDKAVLSRENNTKSWSILMTDIDGSRTGVMSQTFSYQIFRGGKVNYTFLADFSYPLIEEGGFTQWIEAHMAQWYQQYERKDSLAIQAESPTRWSDFASAWVDIFLVEDGLVSGLITQSEPGSSDYRREAFIYDLNAGENLDFAELVKRDVDLLESLRDVATGGDPSTYHHPVLTEDGFALCTDFDAVRGDSIQVVPYALLTPVLRRKSMFTKLAD